MTKKLISFILIMISFNSCASIYFCEVKDAYQITVDGYFEKNNFFEGSKFSVDTKSGKIMGGLINTNAAKTIQIVEKGRSYNNYKMYAIYGTHFDEILKLEISDNIGFHKNKKYPFSMYFNQRSMAGICVR